MATEGQVLAGEAVTDDVPGGPLVAVLDGNEAATLVAHRLSDVCAIYPITPASAMGELADAWSAAGRTNLWGSVPEVIEMQSEGGAAAALHGAVQKGALATSFTASQGLLLMIPTMFKVGGELTPTVLHVAARAVATHALSIFGDHSDVMAVRSTGWAMLCASDVQEAHDFALVAHASTLRSRVPFLHFFDGFRTSHEESTIRLLSDDDLHAVVRETDVLAQRAYGLTPEAPVIRGSAQNPDVFFQSREAANEHYDAVPATVAEVMAELGARTGRDYHLVDYVGHPEADRVIVAMGSATGTIRETVDVLVGQGERVGVAVIRLYRPFPAAALRAALPATVTRIAVLDRTKEPGAPAEPLHLDVMSAFSGESGTLITGGRYGLGSKEFTPADAKAVFDELALPDPRPRFTVGIVDDVTHLSLDVDPTFVVPTRAVQAMFFGLGSDGTVGANKTSIKLIGEHTDLHAQGYFVYDSKKSGSMTVSHLRFGPDPIRSSYLIDEADFVACHQFGLLSRVDVLAHARPGGTVLLNSPYPADEVWEHLPDVVQHHVIDKGLDLWVIDAASIAKTAGLGPRINTVMQPCFFALAEVLPPEEAFRLIKDSIEKSYGRRGSHIVERNHRAIDLALASLAQVTVPEQATTARTEAVARVESVVETLIGGRGDSLPVSAMSIDGTFATGTAALEKRALADEIPIWDPALCIDCGKCAIVCPHAAIRMKVFDPETAAAPPEMFKSKPYSGHELPAGTRLTVQVAPDDCTGCGICVAVCPVRDKANPDHKAIDLEPALEHRDVERPSFEYFVELPEVDRSLVRTDTVKGSQLLQPLFEFSGACAGCGETPYLKLVTQLMGDRMVVANATGCSSIYGGNLPTTPWSKDRDGRGPAWANSLFEDNAEFGLGIRLGVERQTADAHRLLSELSAALPADLVTALLADAPAITDEPGIVERRADVARLREALAGMDDPRATSLASLADAFVPTAVWIVGGDGWAYDIDFGGLDHVLASGRNVNILVLDTEVYSNTGGQASKSTPRGAAAKFASTGKATKKKDLGLLAQAYGDVYVAQVALGANETQTVRAILEAAAWPGPSLILAYSTCIAHGIEMSTSMSHQKAAVTSGYWPLYRFHPSPAPGAHPFSLDSKRPTTSLADFTGVETRYTALDRADHDRSEYLLSLAQADIDERWHYYEQLAGVERSLSAEADEELGHPERIHYAHHGDERPETD
ncbi:MAG TPA: pyruvate:ferredoxin (flavodoxin) oxidoreductase [Candidatus Angelobacter sp.]|nr:pyruvate:ferredoxin (flavodoxin) oxidoreductase [Candidatus Angelobacter sp.]